MRAYAACVDVAVAVAAAVAAAAAAAAAGIVHAAAVAPLKVSHMHMYMLADRRCRNKYALTVRINFCRFWKTNVGSQSDVKNGMFGAAIKAINGPLECSGGDSTTPKKRYAIYVNVLPALNVNESPQEGGCYN